MNLDVYKINGKKANRKIELSNAVFGIDPNDHAIYLDVKRYMAKRRQGTSKSKERGEIRGSRAKLRRQKGLGHARVGDIKNPIFRGGGRAFGPQPRVYDIKVNKKVKALARRSALSYKAKENKITVVEDFAFDKPETKKYVEILDNLQAGDLKTLVVLSSKDDNILLSARNVSYSNILQAKDINTYEVLNADHVFLVENAIQEIEKLLN
ncbi:MAG: 50S ribosomal protein L4 [Flavobacteriales bacterium]